MELTVLERLLLLNQLPVNGDVQALRIIQKLREKIGFTEDEQQALKFTQTGDKLTWDITAPQTVAIGIDPKSLLAIRTFLEKLSAKGEVTASHLSLFDKFLPDETE